MRMGIEEGTTPPSTDSLRWLAVAVVVAATIGIAATFAPLIVALSVLTLVGGVMVVVRPDFASLLVIGLIYSNAAVVAVTVHGVPAVAALAVPLLLAVPLAYNMARGIPVVVPPGTGWLMIFTAAQLIGTMLSAHPQRSLEELQVYFTEGLALYLAVFNVITSRRQLWQAVEVVVAVTAAIGMLSIFQWLTRTYDQDYLGLAQVSSAVIKNDAGVVEQPRISGPIGENNRYGQVLAVATPLALAVVWRYRSLGTRLLWSVAVGLVLIATALTYSRGAAIGTGLVLLCAVIVRGLRPRNMVLLAIPVVVVLAVVPGYRERLVSLEALSEAAADAGEGQADGAMRGRLSQNLAAIQMFADRPVFGIGPGTFALYYPEYADDIEIQTRQKQKPETHNLLLDVATHSGAVGLVAFAGFVLVIVRQLWWQQRDGDLLATGFLLAILAYQVTGLFLQLSYARYFWLLMALAAAAIRTSHPESSKEQDERFLGASV